MRRGRNSGLVVIFRIPDGRWNPPVCLQQIVKARVNRSPVKTEREVLTVLPILGMSREYKPRPREAVFAAHKKIRLDIQIFPYKKSVRQNAVLYFETVCFVTS